MKRFLCLLSVLVVLGLPLVGCAGLVDAVLGPQPAVEGQPTTGQLIDDTVPDWLELVGALTSMPALIALGVGWKKLRKKDLGAKKAEEIGGELVANIQAIRNKAKEGKIGFDEINALLESLQEATPEVEAFIKEIKAKQNIK